MICSLQDKATALVEITVETAKIVDDMKTCDFASSSFSSLLARIQKNVGAWHMTHG
jgi:hypothetical protein